MKERPILFSAPMVRALLSGTKTQTRRAMKPQPHHFYAGAPYGPPDQSGIPDGGGVGYPRIDCPYGVPGDRLWVREAWRTVAPCDDQPPRDITPGVMVRYEADAPAEDGISWGRLRPGMFMPRWASRIALEVTGVRFERLQDISEDDSRAEGAPGYEEGFDAPPPDDENEWSYRASYRRVWETINGPGSWDANHWVWVVEFRGIK